ncbi:uncharacterized protein BDV17DRAFT_246359 [Aspergillus undulatus]|uniref:uncharacterized protein n=1 Tax=Aspergillus undulatus TaxID=1810928 RepID=UPI003CCE14B9
MNEAMKSGSGSAILQENPRKSTHYEGDSEHARPRRTIIARRCNCVNEGEDEQDTYSAMGSIHESYSTMDASVSRPGPLTLSHGNSSLSPPRGRASRRTPSSPDRAGQRSPLQANSPASLIFERSVQEDILIPQTSPSIPSHIRTENHIPPVLEASSAAITDSGLNPDSVEIVTHNIHQPATNGVHTDQQLRSPSPENAAMSIGDTEEPPLANQSQEVNDIRRLSFISFADVVNAENAETGEYPPSNDLPQRSAGSQNPSATAYRNISPSPLYSPVSSHGFGTSPPTSISTSLQGLELSPHRGSRGAESPLLAVQRPVSPSLSGDLNIETMRQALRRTGSGDMGASRSQPTNTTVNDD